MTKKELLTFSQLSNLEWQFYQYQKERDDDNKKNIISGNKITKEMFKTENFIKIDYINGIEKRSNAYEEKGIEGLGLMRRKCGIALEYLESGSEEGKFLSDWEVIGGWDNYSLALESVRGLIERFGGEFNKNELLTRKETEELSEIKSYFELGVSILENEAVSKITIIFFAIGGKIKKFIKEIEKAKQRIFGDEVSDEVKSLENRFTGKLEYKEKISFYDTKLRVSAFKKGGTVVVAFRNIKENTKLKKSIDKNNLPNEIYQMKSLIENLKKDYPDIETIYTTGFGIGGELAILKYLCNSSISKCVVFGEKKFIEYDNLLVLDSFEEVDKNLQYFNKQEMDARFWLLLFESLVGLIGSFLVIAAAVSQKDPSSVQRSINNVLASAGIMGNLVFNLDRNSTENHEMWGNIKGYLDLLKTNEILDENNILIEDFENKESFLKLSDSLSIRIEKTIYLSILFELSQSESANLNYSETTIDKNVREVTISFGSMGKEYKLKEYNGVFINANINIENKGLSFLSYLTLKSQIKKRMDKAKIERLILKPNKGMVVADNIKKIIYEPNNAIVVVDKEVKEKKIYEPNYKITENSYFPFINKNGEIQNRLRDEYISSIIATELKLNGIPNEKYINGVKEKCLIYSVINSSL
ncbi:MAG: hypothetical protein ACRC6K_02910, partial [Fusobacteriaceae bacterium]